MEDEPIFVNLLLKTWTSDIGGIYDYSTKSVITIKDIIAESTYVVRNKDNNIENISQHSDIPSESDLLFHVLTDINNKYSLYNPIPKHLKFNKENLNYLNNKIWYVIKPDNAKEDDNCNEEYSLSENDIIKFGKVKFAVQKIHFENENYEPASPINNSKKYSVSELNKKCPPVFDYEFIVDTDKISNKEICSFCKSQYYKNNEESETDDGNSDTLIYLCDCENKLYFHLECFRKKLYRNGVVKSEKQNDKSITIKKFQCSNCKKQYPTKYKFKNKEKEINYVLEEYKEPANGDYMILESLDYMSDEQYCKSIHIVKLNTDYIKIGRESDNDICEKDISISRCHAIFLYNKNEGKIYLQNKSSKFGTSVLVKKEINLLNKKIYLQVGRTYIEAYKGIKEKEKY